jgi:hypothetical protein
METLETCSVQPSEFKYECTLCEYNTIRKSQYERHLGTSKHQSIIDNVFMQDPLQCNNCNKKYKDRSGLWKHKKKCKIDENVVIDKANNTMDDVINDNAELKKLMLDILKNNNELQKQNQDFQLQMLEICKTSNNVNINNNSHNKTFNLQVFLNEECKDAMNLSDFIKSILLQPNNLEDLGEFGYVEGMSKIILKELSNTAQNKRPVHCSDIKRETLYVKEENKWEKEGPENLRLKHAIRDIEKKNMAVLMNEWKADHPDHKNGDSNENNIYMKLVKEIMNGSAENINKVIRRLAKEIIIEK